MRRSLMLLLLIGSMVLSVMAQLVVAGTDEPGATEEPTAAEESGDCPILVQNALELTQDRCEMIGNNEVCYGHSELEAASRPGFPDFQFDEPGDIEDVIEMQSLSLSAMDTVRDIWGVLLMNVQAQVEDEAQSDITFVVFGDTDLEAPATLIEVSVQENTNLRLLPDTSSDLIGVVVPGQTFTVNGRTEDGSWLRARFINEQGGVQLGWLAASLVQTTDDLNTLETVAPDELTADSPLQYGPMQAFYFRSGVEDAPCEAAPNSGMMIQTPEGQASVTLWIDEVIIELDGTIYLQAEADGNLTAYALDGSVSLTVDGETRTAVEGTQITVPLDENLGADGAPTAPTAYDPDDLQSLPTDLLPESVEIADPLASGAGVPAAGNWLFSWGVSELTCPDGSVSTFESSGAATGLSVSADGATLTWGGGPYSRSAAGLYTRSFVDLEGNLHQETLNVSGIDRITGETTIDFSARPCTLTVPFSMQLVAG